MVVVFDMLFNVCFLLHIVFLAFVIAFGLCEVEDLAKQSFGSSVHRVTWYASNLLTLSRPTSSFGRTDIPSLLVYATGKQEKCRYMHL